MADRSLHKERVDFEGATNLKGTTTISGDVTVTGAGLEQHVMSAETTIAVGAGNTDIVFAAIPANSVIVDLQLEQQLIQMDRLVRLLQCPLEKEVHKLT